MAVTLHWIAEKKDGNLELKSALGGFRYLPNKHNGENIAASLFDVLKGLKIHDKVCGILRHVGLNSVLQIGGITMDNASNNTCAMDYLTSFLDDHEIAFDARQQQLRFV
jgi:hypothetical protein